MHTSNNPRNNGPVGLEPGYGLNYILFNANWDTVVGNVVDQSMGHDVRAPAPDLYPNYLAHSLQSMVTTHNPGDFRVTIWLIEIGRRGLEAKELREILMRAVPGLSFDICIVGNQAVSHFVEEARRIPLNLYRSPNAMHEFLLLLVLKQASTPKVAIVDPDTCFLRRDAIPQVFDLLATDPSLWVAAFIERGKQRPYGATFVPARERMHSVALFFDRLAFCSGFLDTTNWSLDLLEKAKGIANEDARNYYERLRAFDTLSLLTEYLKYNFENDRILALNDHVRFVETSNLTLLSDLLVHTKHLHTDALPPLQQAVAQLELNPSELPELARVMLSAASSRAKTAGSAP